MRYGWDMGKVALGGFKAVWLGLTLFLVRAPADDLYVSTSGDDANPGTSGAPFRSITQAYSKASPGTVIHVMPGVYYEYRSGWGLYLGKNGAVKRPIVLKSQVPGGAVIDGQNAADRNQGFYIEGSYNVVDGFEIRNCPHGGIAIYGNRNHVINNQIHHNGNPESASTNGRDGIFSEQGTAGNCYAGNSIHDNGRPGSSLDHGLYLCGKNELVLNNLLFGNAACGLQIAGYTTVSTMKVYNNVMAWNGANGIVLWMAIQDIEIKNNILYYNGNWGLTSYQAHGAGVVVDRNLTFGNGQGDYNFRAGGSDYGYTFGTTLSADPDFVNRGPAGFDAHLASGSPAIEAGLNLHTLVPASLDGQARPATGPWDLGAYFQR